MPIGRYIQLSSVLLLLFSKAALCDYKDDIGHTALATELGTAIPSGSGVKVTQAEADSTNDDPDVVITYSPDPGNAEFAGKIIADVTATSAAYSGHATSVGKFFYGNSQSIAPGITTIDVYLADDWLSAGFLRADLSEPEPRPQPGISSSRISNHSWVGDDEDDAVDSDVLRRLDWVIERDEFFQAVGVINNIVVNQPLLSSAYNAISVGRTDGMHATGTVAVDSIYTANRTRPDIVAPSGFTSSATPMVASAAALLVETGHGTPGLSTDPVSTSTINRNGDLIFNAERAETIKAALMAGAERATSNSTAADISDYRADIVNQSGNGLDTRFGAGQLNLYNSYNIIAAGEQNSMEDVVSTGGQIGSSGFDYDPSFGGGNGSNNEASYFFSTGMDAARLAVSLVWSIKIHGGAVGDFDGTATVYDLDLFLYDTTSAASENEWQLLGSSESQIENTENLWVALEGSRDYAIRVKPGSGQAAFEWDYALAWQVTAVPSDQDDDGIPDDIDNCTAMSNAGQTDTDLDGHGNACDADFNNDCLTNILDLSLFKAAFFTVNPVYDLNDDGGIVNLSDLAILKSLFFMEPGPSASGALCNP